MIEKVVARDGVEPPTPAFSAVFSQPISLGRQPLGTSHPSSFSAIPFKIRPLSSSLLRTRRAGSLGRQLRSSKRLYFGLLLLLLLPEVMLYLHL